MALAPVVPIADILTSEPLVLQIHKVLDPYLPTSTVEELAVVSSLLKYTIPDVYLQLPEETQNVIVRIFRSAVGLGNLLGRIDMLSALKADILGDVAKLLNVHLLLLDKVLDAGIVLSGCLSALSVREMDKLLYKGRCFSIVREVDMKFRNIHVPAVLASMEAYSTFLTRELLSMYGKSEISYINVLLWSLMSLGSLQKPYFDVMMHRETMPLLRESVVKMKRFERKLVLLKFLNWVFARYLTSEVDNVAAVYVLTSTYFDASVCDELMCENVISHYNYALNQVMALLVRSGLDSNAFNALVLKLLVNWGSSGLLQLEPIVRQEFRTHLLISMCSQLSLHSVGDLLQDRRFVTAISNHLSSLSTRVKSLGVHFADVLSDIAGKDRIFNMSDDVVEVHIPQSRISVSDVKLDCDDAWDILESPKVEEPNDTEINALESALQPVTIKDDLDMDDPTLDDPTLASAKVVAPIYVRDILAYLTVDSKNASAYEEQRSALKTAPTLLRQKLRFGSEVSFYAEELITTLTGLTNQYEESDFEDLKLNCMIAVVVSCPNVSTHVCQLLLTGDYSLQQRMCLLSCLSLAAREMRGFSDDKVQLSFSKEKFPSKMLPEALHRQYLALESDHGYGRIENGIQNQLMAEASEEAQNLVNETHGMPGKVLRVSASLRKKETSTDLVSKQDLASFNKTVGKNFFFPLVAVWYESRGIDIGPYTPILVAHFLRTLSLILHAAYPAAVDLRDMAREYVGLVTPVIQNVDSGELQVIESVVTGMLLVCDMFDLEYLVTFETQLSVIEHVVGSWWESLIDDRVKSLCAGLLLRISSVRTHMERTIMDQNGLM